LALAFALVWLQNPKPDFYFTGLFYGLFFYWNVTNVLFHYLLQLTNVLFHYLLQLADFGGNVTGLFWNVTGLFWNVTDFS